jgi:hypothetical protein
MGGVGWSTDEVGPHTACLVVNRKEAAQRLAQGVIHAVVPFDVSAQ